MADLIRVTGAAELIRALNKADRETGRLVKERLAKVGETVRAEGASRFSRYSSVSAAGFRVYSRINGVSVAQSKRKVTGRRPDWGTLQMNRALEPALEAKQSEVEAELEKALDDIERIVERWH